MALRYSPIDGEGWGIFILDETGMFAAVTDYGNCAYKWPHSGCEDFRHFFAQERTNWGYFGGSRQNAPFPNAIVIFRGKGK
ncbi:hypothetical protein B7C51_19310 [Paenibacillus larvae subsp. pulvifaciens]|uniref:Uncharacterized protein n=1 Tax=Paenibacillus larvae subsp. pulvifaciens TaxID=1477 RepID=A0A1V0UWF6_9BACL|nr:hypothetical protein B7C51_03365 [Paenibacillus larvae subsp. pulvifaciens]ARF69506.1 hypothetical protein B7C51_19310 [Paenibacillus larvae subsp. pulvifaciens]